MSDEQLVLCGSVAEIHDRAVGRTGDLERTMEQLKANPARPFAIGLSRYNFFELQEIARFWTQLAGKGFDAGVEFALRPLDSIADRFQKQVDELKAADIPAVVIDPELTDLLETVERAAKGGVVSETMLLRLLGMVCDQAFVGPYRLLFDPLYACNLDCIYCNNFSVARRNVPKEVMESDPLYRFRGKSLDPERFKALMREARELGVEAVSVVGSGEPTLYPHLAEVLKFAHELGFENIDISTNGVKFTRELAEAAIDCELSSVTFSVTGATAESFARFHPQGAKHYDTIMKNIKRLSKLKRRHGAKKPTIVVLHVVTKRNLDELEASVEQAANAGADMIWFQPIHPREFSHDLELGTDDVETLKNEYARAKATAGRLGIELPWEFEFQLARLRPGGSWSGPQLASCPVGWWFSIITCAERVNFCCGWKEVGCIEGTSYAELWRSERYRAYRHFGKHIRERGGVRFENGKTLMDDFCFWCDNFNFVAEIFGLLEKTGLLEFYSQDKPFDGFSRPIRST